MDANEPFVNDDGQLMFQGHEIYPCCLERVGWPHGDCDFSQFVNIPAGKTAWRTFIPHKRKETNGV